MCSRHLRNDFTVSNTPARKSIKDEDDKTITEEKVSCKIQNTTNDQGFGYINKGELCQDDTYQEKLLPPDIFKLTRLDKSNLSNPIDTFETTKPSTYRAIKRALVEDDPPSIESTTKRVNLKQSIDNKNEIKKNINLNSYTRSSLWHTKINSRIIYRDAIKKIDIDSNGLFKDSVLEKMVKIIKRRRLLKSSIDLSPTYSNIRKYALEKISSLLNEDTIDLDITITPGMSLSDLRSNCISNNSFFKKLRENCEKIVKDLQLTPDNYLSHVFQWHIIFHLNNSSNSTKIKLHAPKYKNLSKLKELIIDTISKLPNSIICEIEKFDQNNIVNALFSNIHGVLVAKSSIKNLSIFFNYNKNKFVNERFYDNLNSLNDLLEKIGNIVRESCIFHEGVFSPNESTTEQLSKYLLSDMYGISSKFHKKLKLPAKDMSKYQELMDSIRLDHNYTKCPIADTPMKKEPQIPESHPISETCTTPSEIIDIKNEKTEISNSYNNEQTATTSDIKNASKPEQYSITKEFNIKPYRRINLCSTEFRSSIYEDAIKKIDIDSNEIFKNSVLEKIGRYITIRGLTKSSLNLSQTYSNISKYLLNKVSPYISDIMTTTCICITPGLHLSDIKNNCLSNNIFFERLSKRCKKIIESINVIPDDYFLNIIQSNIYFSASERLAVARKRNKRKKFCSEVKLLIMDTIYN
uniref:hypothetical protein n=1 Tax=Candidatus Ichthyocystis sparus TaxID=1561004 RepID=UPI000B2AE8BB